jgi:hypothetical protein
MQNNSIRKTMTILSRIVIAVFIFVVICGNATALAQITCTTARHDRAYLGSCVEQQDTVFRIRIALHPPEQLWRGTVTEGNGFVSPIAVDDSIFRYGRYWAQITSFQQRPDSLLFSFRSSGSVVPGDDDLAILQAARAYLDRPSRWSRDPDPDVNAAVKQFLDNPSLSRGGFCPAREQRTLFCAIYHASLENAGEFWWGRPAVNAVRAAVIAESAGRLRHPLMQFNGAPETSLADVQRVLDVAAGYLKERRMCNVQYWVWGETQSDHCR